MKAIYLLSATTITIVLIAGCVENRPAPGKYETTNVAVDANGTVHKTNKKTNIYYDKNGKMHGSVDKKSTTDPKGLFNKSTTESHGTIK